MYFTKYLVIFSIPGHPAGIFVLSLRQRNSDRPKVGNMERSPEARGRGGWVNFHPLFRSFNDISYVFDFSTEFSVFFLEFIFAPDCRVFVVVEHSIFLFRTVERWLKIRNRSILYVVDATSFCLFDRRGTKNFLGLKKPFMPSSGSPFIFFKILWSWKSYSLTGSSTCGNSWSG